MKELIDTYYRENYRVLVKRMANRLGNQQDAEDCVQEAFCKAIKYFASYDANKSISFDNWFSKILSNCAKDQQSVIRSQGTTKNIDDHYDDIEPVIPNHLGVLSRREIKRIIESRPNTDKETIRLNIMFGYTPKDISFLLNIPIGTIYLQIKRFSKEMKEAYA